MPRLPRLRSPGEFEGLARYLDAFRQYPPLSREAEHELAVKMRRGDLAARRSLASHHMALVVAVARRQHRGSVRMEDVIQEGNLGLMRALDKFEPEEGSRFATYAIWWVRAFIGKYMKGARSSVRPRSGRVARDDLSLDGAASEESDSTLLDELEDDAPGPEAVFLARENASEVRKALAGLRPRIGELGWEIVHGRLQRDERRTLEEIGRPFGLSRERVRQVELKTKTLLVGHMQRRALGAA